MRYTTAVLPAFIGIAASHAIKANPPTVASRVNNLLKPHAVTATGGDQGNLDALTNPSTDASLVPTVAQPDVAKRDIGANFTGVNNVSGLPFPSEQDGERFEDFAFFRNLSQSAATPPGYFKSFGNVHKRVWFAMAPIFDQAIASYDPSTCASWCNEYPKCQGFNIFLSREPAISPAENGPNPGAEAIPTCTLWSQQVTVDDIDWADTVLVGPPDDNGKAFERLIVASNGYNKATPPPFLEGYNGPGPMTGFHEEADPDLYLETQSYQSAINVSTCAGRCNNVTRCNFFEAYAAGNGFNCSFWTRAPLDDAAIGRTDIQAWWYYRKMVL